MQFDGVPCKTCGGTRRYAGCRSCVACQTRKRKEHRDRNLEDSRAKWRAWSRANPEYQAQRQRAWHEKNGEHNKERCRDWRARNPQWKKLYAREHYANRPR